MYTKFILEKKNKLNFQDFWLIQNINKGHIAWKKDKITFCLEKSYLIF